VFSDTCEQSGKQKLAAIGIFRLKLGISSRRTFGIIESNANELPASARKASRKAPRDTDRARIDSNLR
jgi:hypothetical protein